jgi:hypothetical protein
MEQDKKRGAHHKRRFLGRELLVLFGLFLSGCFPGMGSEASVHAETSAPVKTDNSTNQALMLAQAGVPPSVSSLTTGARHRRKDEEFGGIHMEKPRLGLELSYESEEDRRSGPNFDTRNITQEFTERMILETRGWAYHPALLKYTLRFEPAWRQIREDRDPGEDGSRNVFLPGYVADFNFLEQKPYSLHLFGKREEVTTLRSGLALISDTEIDSYGADLSFKQRMLPTLLGYTHRDITQTGFFDSREERDDFRFVSRHDTGNSRTRLTATHSDNVRTSRGFTTSIENTTGAIQNTCDFGEAEKASLDSLLSYRQTESNSFDSSDSRMNENLHWRHRPNLRTDYNLDLSRTTAGDFEIETRSLRAQMIHLFRESLTTTVGGGVRMNDFTGGREQIYSGDLDMIYRRKIPWGSMSLIAGFDYEVTDRAMSVNFMQVIGESLILSIGTPTFLANDNVDLPSIQVTDATRTIVFIEGIDYRVDVLNGFVRISRIPLGGIAEGQQVLVSYRSLRDPSFDDALFSRRYGADFYLWNALSISYRHQKLDQNILSGTPAANPVDDTFQSGQIRLDWKWTETQFFFEDTDRLSGISVRRWDLSETLRVRPWREIYLSIRGLYGNTLFKERGETETFTSVRGKIDWAPARWSRLSVEGFRDVISGEFERIVNTGALATLKLSYRIWNMSIIYGFLDERDEIGGASRYRQTIRFELIRVLW